MKYAAAALVLLVIAGLILLLLALNRQRTTWKPGAFQMAALSDVPQSAWDALAGKRILFAHMSVGADILAGVEDLLRENPNIKLTIRDWDGSTPISQPGLWHAKLGSNGNPEAKIERFTEMLGALKANPPDIALMKLCYVDILPQTDVPGVDKTYQTAVANLQKSAPGTRFLHLTVPIQSPSPGTFNRLKRGLAGLAGRSDPVDSNAARERYNASLRRAYAEGGRILDLAAIESSGPEGRCVAGRGAGEIPMMLGKYTTDGGHLSSAGRRRLAEQFLIALARSAAASDQPRP